MTHFEIFSILIVLAAVFSYANFRYVRLPTTIGIMLLALLASLAIIALGGVAQGFRNQVASVVAGIRFDQVLLHGMLAFLLFAGSLHVDLNDLKREWVPVALLALVGTAVSTVLVGGALWVALGWLGIGVPFPHCLLFGALISPTDPIAVLGIMKRVGAPPALETQLAGESLFNDGIGVVLFLALAEYAADPTAATPGHVALLLVREAIGGAAVGLVAGLVTYSMLRRVDNYQVEVLLTLALAMGGYALAERLHASAPIASVVSGVFVGSRGRIFAMSKTTEAHIDTFWELVDEVCNAVLFLLIGLEVLVLPFERTYLAAGAVAVVAVLAARWVSVGAIVGPLRKVRRFERGTVTVLTWGGLRGGISVALALALPQVAGRSLLIAVTYCVVVFSVVVQGMTIGRVIRRVAA